MTIYHKTSVAKMTVEEMSADELACSLSSLRTCITKLLTLVYLWCGVDKLVRLSTKF